MSVPVIAFFNNKGGVGKTTLVYHLAWMFAELGLRVIAADLDPQANLSGAFLSEDQLEDLWPDGDHPGTIYGCLQPLIRGTGDIAEPRVVPITLYLGLLAGDLSLAGFEDELSSQWPECLDRKERAFRVISAFWRAAQKAAGSFAADVVITDLGPSLGATNRAALIASDYVVVPLSPDLFSLQGLRNLGPKLRTWREEWTERLARNPDPSLPLPAGRMQPVGYVLQQHSIRLDRPVKAYDKWIGRIPSVYHEFVLGARDESPARAGSDPHCLALLKHYRSLMPMAQEVRKPLFMLKPADGAIGGHYQAAQDAYQDFRGLASKILARAGIHPPVISPA